MPAPQRQPPAPDISGKTQNSHQPIPPNIQTVRIYFSQKGLPAPEAGAFFLLHESRGWTSLQGNPIHEWKPAARRWIASVLQTQPWLFDRTIH